MKFIPVVLCIVVVAAAAPSRPSSNVLERGNLPVRDYEEVRDKYGQYALRDVTPEGIVVSERGRLVRMDNEGFIMIVEGQASYATDDGQMYVIKYYTGNDRVQDEGREITIPGKIQVAELIPERVVETEY